MTSVSNMLVRTDSYAPCWDGKQLCSVATPLGLERRVERGEWVYAEELERLSPELREKAESQREYILSGGLGEAKRKEGKNHLRGEKVRRWILTGSL
tara:strand:+ start:1503 stop:1793 length:291 start_codon:yes stop_codon:yes gene_type:complete